MSSGVYGITKPALITANDVDIYYHYRPNRASDSSDFASFKKIDGNILNSMSYEESNQTLTLPGMYNLRLPMDIFGNKGIYTIYIKPKEIITTISDVSTLAAYPNIRGIILNSDDFGGGVNLSSDNALVGYRVEYFDENDERLDFFRLITSSNKCEPMTTNVSSSLQKNIRYRFNMNSNLLFCTLTPSTALSFNATALPYIGKTTQKIALVNTKFNPIMLEVEMVDHDFDTISTMLEGEQIRNLDNGTITTFNSDGEIYNQMQVGTYIDAKDGKHHDFKVKSQNIIDERNKLQDIKDTL